MSAPIAGPAAPGTAPTAGAGATAGPGPGAGGQPTEAGTGSTAGPPRAIVVVPARDEEARVAACIDALARQGHGHGVRPWVVLVDDGSRDDTRAVAARALARSGLVHEIVPGPQAGVGWARRVGLDRAARWALHAGAGERCLLVSTDADTVADPAWLDALLAAAGAGSPVIAGDVRLRDDEPVDPALVARRRGASVARLAAVRAVEGAAAAHHHFAASNLALTVGAYERVGGLPVPRALEDDALLERVRAAGLPVARVAGAVVRTSPRTDSRAPRGLGVDGAVERWRTTRRHHHEEFGVERLAALVGDVRVSVVVPTREDAATIGGVLERTVGPLVAAGVVHEVIVVDSASVDGTAEIARRWGAVVLQEDDLRRDVGPCRGKGDAMWRALHVATGDVVAFLDADTADPRVAHLAGTLGPLLADPEVQMVRGTFDRPHRTADGALEPHGGGRVTELAARPLLNLHVPLLAGFRQPLAGEFAGRRALLRSLAFPVGYGVEVATLIDALRQVGLQALAECDLGVRQNRHQPLRDLTRMAYAVLAAVERRIDRGAPIAGTMLLPWEPEPAQAVPVEERPPVDAAGGGPDADGPSGADAASGTVAAGVAGAGARPCTDPAAAVG